MRSPRRPATRAGRAPRCCSPPGGARKSRRSRWPTRASRPRPRGARGRALWHGRALAGGALQRPRPLRRRARRGRAGLRARGLRHGRLAAHRAVEAAVRAGGPTSPPPRSTGSSERTRAAGTDWALGIQARSRALLSDGEDADALYREAIERLARTPLVVHLRPRPAPLRRVAAPRAPPRGRARAAARGARAVRPHRGRGVRRARPPRAARHRRDRPQAHGGDARRADARRRRRSPGSPSTGTRTPRSARSCSSARARSSTTCARCSRSSTSRSRKELGRVRRRPASHPAGVFIAPAAPRARGERVDDPNRSPARAGSAASRDRPRVGLGVASRSRRTGRSSPRSVRPPRRGGRPLARGRLAQDVEPERRLAVPPVLGEPALGGRHSAPRRARWRPPRRRAARWHGRAEIARGERPVRVVVDLTGDRLGQADQRRGQASVDPSSPAAPAGARGRRRTATSRPPSPPTGANRSGRGTPAARPADR